ncbi:MAG: lipoyl synthase [Bacteroidetes bacterium GWE2_29_8]|nr:MAG: lipoyl synthase [Bacteroidetes bacterium GWE2_29_8]
MENTDRKPEWLKIKLPKTSNFTDVKNILKAENINTICQSGNCPNLGECWDSGHATFMILGNICTRSCAFCNVATGKPLSVDLKEPIRLARVIKAMKLKHCIITSVDRDDLEDYGSKHWHNTIKTIRELNPEVTMETLIPDFKGNFKALDRIISVKPNIVSHNLETVLRLTLQIRKMSIYERSLKVLSYLSQNGIRTKSGIMVGIGEKKEEVIDTMRDLRDVGCKIFTIGQYLQPTSELLPVEEYVRPEVFEEYRLIGLELGFEHVESAPLVRSSYRADKHL